MKLLDMEVNEIRSAVIVNPVNCVGVMGKGLAKVMKSIYPWAFDDYVKKCKSNGLRPGEIVVSTHPQTLIEFEQPPPVIIHAATKDHWRNKTKIEWINSVLKQLNLIDYSDIQSAYLSEGQKRKINIASFILSKADLYLLDEPFNNLDRKTTDFLQEIFDMKINAGAKIIFSSHDRSDDDFPLIDMNLFN